MKVRRIDSNDDSTFGHGDGDWLYDADAVAQCVYCSLRLLLGEWFWDVSKGTAWFDQPEGQPAIMDNLRDAAFSEAELKRVILATPGVSEIEDFYFAVDPLTRIATAKASIATIYGPASPIVVRQGS